MNLTSLQSHVKNVGFSIDQFNQEFVGHLNVQLTRTKFICRAFLTILITCRDAL